LAAVFCIKEMIPWSCWTNLNQPDVDDILTCLVKLSSGRSFGQLKRSAKNTVHLHPNKPNGFQMRHSIVISLSLPDCPYTSIHSGIFPVAHLGGAQEDSGVRYPTRSMSRCSSEIESFTGGRNLNLVSANLTGPIDGVLFRLSSDF
jgi:hypothetical protein